MSLFLAIFFIVYAFKLNKNSAKWGIIKVIQIAAALVIVFGIVGGILLIPAMFIIYNEVLYLIATEWFTIENIINLLK